MNYRVSIIRMLCAVGFIAGVGGGVAYAAPTFTWTPSLLTQTVGVGQSKTVAVTLKASEAAANVTVVVVPELAPYIRVSPSSFQTIQKDAETTLNVIFAPGPSAKLGTYQGTIHLTLKGTLAKPLPVSITVTASTEPPGLPPDPGEAGKATLQGIDSDHDGVRDDIQRYIAITYQDSAKTRAALTQFAKGMQAALLVAGNIASAKTANQLTGNGQYCLWSLYGDNGDVLRKDLKAEIINTHDRYVAYSNYGRLLNGMVEELAPIDQWKARCDVNLDVLPN